jgi:hypothetical protein
MIMPRVSNRSLYNQAKAKVTPNENGSYAEEKVQQELATILREKMNPDKLAFQQAAQIILNLTKQTGEDDDDDDGGSFQLELFGDHYNYNPERLIKDGMGNIIEEDQAPLSFILAELARSSEHVARAARWNSRKAQKATHFQKWVGEEIAKGRKPVELTWGNCARETGILRFPKPRAVA